MNTIHTDKYYTTMEYLLKKYDENSRKYAFKAKTISEYDDWKKKLKEILLDITGINKMRKRDLSPQVLETCQMEGYRRDKIIIQTEDKVWMPFYMLVPDDMKQGEKRACAIAAHGHGGSGKYQVAGRVDIPSIKNSIERYNADYGIKLVKQGYIVFCPDARGSCERREWMTQGDEESKFMGSSCTDLNNAAISLGQSLTGMWVWDLMRLVDYMETLDVCDEKRIGCCGFSGGGLQCLWLAALEDRVKAAVISGYFHGYRDTLLKTNLCGCNFIPHLWEYADIGDIAALIAPRSLLIESGRMDRLNGKRGIIDVLEQVEVVKKAYGIFYAKENLTHFIFDGEHKWNGEKTYEFFNKNLK